MSVCLGGPQLVGVDQDVHLEEATGRMVNLSCEAQGHPLPSISWNIVGSQVPALTRSANLTSRQAVTDQSGRRGAAVHHATLMHSRAWFCSL